MLFRSEHTSIVFVSPSAVLGDFVLPDSVKTIADSAFSGNSTLTSFTVTANSQLKKIGYGAFSYCANLVKVTLPVGNDIVIDSCAFINSAKLAEINLEGVKAVGEYAFYKTALRNTLTNPISLTCDGVIIGAYAFAELSTLQGVCRFGVTQCGHGQ